MTRTERYMLQALLKLSCLMPDDEAFLRRLDLEMRNRARALNPRTEAIRLGELFRRYERAIRSGGLT